MVEANRKSGIEKLILAIGADELADAKVELDPWAKEILRAGDEFLRQGFDLTEVEKRVPGFTAVLDEQVRIQQEYFHKFLGDKRDD